MAKVIFFFSFFQCYTPKSSCTSGLELPDHQQDPFLPGPKMQIYIQPLHGLHRGAGIDSLGQSRRQQCRVDATGLELG